MNYRTGVFAIIFYEIYLYYRIQTAWLRYRPTLLVNDVTDTSNAILDEMFAQDQDDNIDDMESYQEARRSGKGQDVLEYWRYKIYKYKIYIKINKLYKYKIYIKINKIYK